MFKMHSILTLRSFKMNISVPLASTCMQKKTRYKTPSHPIYICISPLFTSFLFYIKVYTTLCLLNILLAIQDILSVSNLSLSLNMSGESLVRNPLGGVSWSSLLHHAVDLFEGKALGFWNQEVGVDESTSAETSPDEEDRRLQVSVLRTDHVWSNDSDNGVPEPVGCGGETNTTRSDWEREDFTDENPSSRTPGGGEEEYEDGDECDLGVDSRDVVGDSISVDIKVSLVESNSDTNDGNKELTDQHSQGSPDEKWTTTEFLDGIEGDWGGENVDQGEDQRDQESVLNGTGGLQEGGGVVKDEVDTSPVRLN